MSGLRVCVLHNNPAAHGCRQTAETDGKSSGFVESDAGVLDQVAAVVEALKTLGIEHSVTGVSSLPEIALQLADAARARESTDADAGDGGATGGETVIFNLVESLPQREYDCNLVPALCEACGLPVTGNPTPALVIGYDKWLTKSVLVASGVTCPRAVLVRPGESPADYLRRLPEPPLIVKPLEGDAGEGIDVDSVFNEHSPALADKLREIHRRFNQPGLVEQYISGREINVSILEVDGRPHVLPAAEIDFSAFPPGRPHVVGYSAKWLSDSFDYQHTPRVIPAPLPPEALAAIVEAATNAWQAVGCRGYARVDMRLDARLRPLVLEVNPNPDISPDAGFVAALAAGGFSYERFVDNCIKEALRGLCRLRRHRQMIVGRRRPAGERERIGR